MAVILETGPRVVFLDGENISGKIRSIKIDICASAVTTVLLEVPCKSVRIDESGAIIIESTQSK